MVPRRGQRCVTKAEEGESQRKEADSMDTQAGSGRNDSSQLIIPVRRKDWLKKDPGESRTSIPFPQRKTKRRRNGTPTHPKTSGRKKSAIGEDLSLLLPYVATLILTDPGQYITSTITLGH